MVYLKQLKTTIKIRKFLKSIKNIIYYDFNNLVYNKSIIKFIIIFLKFILDIFYIEYINIRTFWKITEISSLIVCW